MRLVQALLICAAVALIAGCNAFIDSSEVGPGPEPVNNGQPNNGQTNNATTGNNAGYECLSTAECDLCVGGQVYPCEEVFQNCFVLSDPYPCEGECIDEQCAPPSTNNGETCLEIVCSSCTSTGVALICDDPECPQMAMEDRCPGGTGCIDGRCQPCADLCDPDQPTRCGNGGDTVQACAVDRWGCTAPIESRCDPETCVDDQIGGSCALEGQPCDASSDDFACLDPLTLLECQPGGASDVWARVDQCPDGTRCSAEEGACVEFEHTLEEL